MTAELHVRPKLGLTKTELSHYTEVFEKFCTDHPYHKDKVFTDVRINHIN